MLFLAVTPIVFIMVGIVVLKKPASWVSLLAMVFTFCLALVAWRADTADLVVQTKNGALTALQTIFLVWSAFTLLEMMSVSGAMDRIKIVISSFAKDRRIQVIMIAFCLGAFLEGVAGAGTPAAIAAPFLVGLGFDPLTAAAAALISNGVPSSFGGAGVSTISGFDAIQETVSIANATAMTGRIHMVGMLVVPFVVLFVVFGRGCYKKLLGYLLCVGLCMAATMFLVSNFIGPEITSILTGAAGIVASAAYVKLRPSDGGEAFRSNLEELNIESKQPPLKAFFPYLVLIVALPVIRFNVPMSILTRYGYPVWVGTVIHSVVIISSFVLGHQRDWLGCLFRAAKKIIPAAISMCSLIALSNMMNFTGMMSLIANTMASTAFIYPALAVIIGTLGSFMTGSTLGSNIMFGPLHVETSSLLHLNPIVTASASSAGGALGNMICPNNVIAVGATVGLTNQEGVIMSRTIKAYCFTAVIYMTVVMLYTYVLFPHFGGF